MVRGWMRGENVPTVLTGSWAEPAQDFALQIRVKALHHWIRKGNADKARHRMVECIGTIRSMERRIGRECGEWSRI
jgi:hypothetical protein